MGSLARRIRSAFRWLRGLAWFPRTRVFVSCTSKGLAGFRAVLCERPESWWPNGRSRPQLLSMLDDKATPDPSVDWSIREASRADLVVLLLGKHHGEVAEVTPDAAKCGADPSRLLDTMLGIPGWREVSHQERLSYTQWEVLAAEAAHVPILVFCPDRGSTHPDLEHYRREPPESEALAERQEVFDAWVQERRTADHFRNSVDLTCKVRTAILRRRRAYLWARVLVALALGLLVLSGLCVWREVAERAQREVAERRLRKHAVELGCALGMLGCASEAAKPLLERALRDLGMLPNQAAETYGEFVRLNSDVRKRRLDRDALAEGKARLARKVRDQMAVIRPGALRHIEFGQGAVELELLLRFWETLPTGRQVRASLLVVRLRRFQRACARADVGDRMRRRAALLDATVLSKSDSRRSEARQTVLECLAQY